MIERYTVEHVCRLNNQLGSVNTLQPKGSSWYQYVGIKGLN